MAEINYQQEGRRILAAFYSALSALKLYPVENETVQTALTELHGLIERVVQNDGTAEVRVVGDFFFLNETRVRLDLTNFSTFGSFARALQDHGIGTVEVHHGIERSEWAPFISMLLQSPDADDPFEAFSRHFERTPTQHIELRQRRRATSPKTMRTRSPRRSVPTRSRSRLRRTRSGTRASVRL